MKNSKENLKVLIVSTNQDFLDGATHVFFVYKNSSVIFPDIFFSQDLSFSGIVLFALLNFTTHPIT